MIGIIVLTIMAGLVSAVVISAVYFLIYQVRINKKLQTGKEMKKMPSPFALLIAVVMIIGILTLVSIIFMVVFYAPKQSTFDEGVVSLNNLSVADYRYYTPEDISGTYAEAYERGRELPGYNRYEKEDGNFLYTYYLSKQDYDILHPKFVLFLEYTGEEDYDIYECEMGFAQDGLADYGGFCDEKIPEYLCFVGNADGDCSFDIYIGTYTQSAYDEAQNNMGETEVMMKETFDLTQSYSNFQLCLTYYGDTTE